MRERGEDPSSSRGISVVTAPTRVDRPVTRPRRRAALVVLTAGSLVAGAGCRDALEPNTDVGLHVRAEVAPNRVSLRDTASLIRMRVQVTNPSRRTIRVVSGGPPYRFAGDPARSRGLWGSLRIANDTSELNGGPGVDWWGDSVYVFPPRRGGYNEYSLTLAEWRARGAAPVAGRYRVRGWFNGREGASAELILVP